MDSRWSGENIMESVNRRIGSIAVAATLAIGQLSGCGREEMIDYSIEGMEQKEQPVQEGERSGLEQLAEEEIWKEEWTSALKAEYIYEGETFETRYGIRVDARVIVPKMAQMSVVEVEEPEFDAEYKEKVAKRLFDSGEIYYGDYSHLPKKDLMDLQTRNESGYTLYLDGFLTRQQLEEDIREQQAALDNMENAGDTYTYAQEYAENKYIGLCGGRLYNLSFEEGFLNAGGQPYCRRKRIIWTVRDMREVCPEKMKEQEELIFSPWTRGNWVENQCQISEEEAGKEAEQLVDKLGLDYSVQSAAWPLLWGESPDYTEIASADNWYVDGYVFAFDLGMDDISFVGYGADEDYKGFYQNKEDEEKQYSMEARLWVYVTDQGIIKMEADNPIEITGVKESVGLLSLDTIQHIMKEKTEEQWEIFRYNTAELTKFNEMELIYFRVRDRENPGKFSYVPTWRLAVVTRDELLNQITVRNPVLVNAIDGFLIDFYDET